MPGFPAGKVFLLRPLDPFKVKIEAGCFLMPLLAPLLRGNVNKNVFASKITVGIGSEVKSTSIEENVSERCTC